MEIVKELLKWLWPNAPWVIPTVAVAILSWRLSRWTKDISDTKCRVDNLACESRGQAIHVLEEDVKRAKSDIDNLPCERHKESISSLELETRQSKVDIGRLPCESHFNRLSALQIDFYDRFSQINVHFANIDSLLSEHSRRLGAVEDKLERWDVKMMDIAFSNASTSRKQSPYSLTNYGEYILQKSFAKICIDENKEYYFGIIETQPHTTPYDVERAALGAVMDSFRTDLTNSVKNFIYNSPAKIEFEGEQHELSTTDIQVAMAIYLRDLYLERVQANGQIVAAPPSNDYHESPAATARDGEADGREG